ncbi:MAG: L,D-transpeptidase [Acidobacteriota bacterium]|nr:L,D-transpeptidase [Acidobacteriota bacterium]
MDTSELRMRRAKTMTSLMFSKVAMVVVLVALIAVQAAAQEPTLAAQPNREIVVSLQDRKLALVEDGRVVRVFRVAVGKPSTPSPEGTFTIQRRVKNPIYQHKGVVVQPGPGNPVGTRWIGLSIKGYGIHGTNEPHSIGKAASHGCIRMGRKDVEELFSLVRVGDTVELIGQRNEETAQLFGGEVVPARAVVEEPVLTARIDTSRAEELSLARAAQ